MEEEKIPEPIEDPNLNVLDYEDGYQLDLGGLQSLNKRQTSKTEVFVPTLFSPIKKNKSKVAGLLYNNNPKVTSLFP